MCKTAPSPPYLRKYGNCANRFENWHTKDDSRACERQAVHRNKEVNGMHITDTIA
jgi:hypothetical protein